VPGAVLQANGSHCIRIKDFTEPADFVAEIVPLDEAMYEAIEQAHLLDLDRFVVVSVSVTQRFESFLADLRPVNEDDPLMVTVNGQPQHLYLKGKAKPAHETRAFDGRALAADSEYRIVWLDHYAFSGPGCRGSDSVAIVPWIHCRYRIPAEVRAESEIYDPIRHFTFALLMMRLLTTGHLLRLRERISSASPCSDQRGEAVQLINGYGNTVLSSDPEDGNRDAQKLSTEHPLLQTAGRAQLGGLSDCLRSIRFASASSLLPTHG